MTITKEEVEKIAHLARLELDDARREKMVVQLDQILTYMDTLKDVNVDGVRLSSGAAAMTNVLREDVAAASPGPDITLAGAPERDGDFYVVPRVVK